MKPFFYQKGICELASKLRGDENVYLGIRPYGFHAGNAVTMVVYPILLCRKLEEMGKIPKFTFYVFLNDWEQDSLDGPDPKLYPFNILPKFTTWQYISDPVNNQMSIVDYWEKVIVNNVEFIRHYFPSVKVISRKNSQMKNMSEMKRCVIQTLKNPDDVLKILKENTNKKVLDLPTIFSSAVCPFCHAARGETEVLEGDKIAHRCNLCGKKSFGKYKNFDYWLYHKPLALPRIEAFNIDLCITGADHYEEGDFIVREKLFKAYGINRCSPMTLYTQLIFGTDEVVMGKSRGNAKLIDLDKLIYLVLTNKKTKKIVIPNKI
jgi:hypothetical protein